MAENAGDYEKQLEKESLIYLKNFLAQKYNWEKERERFKRSLSLIPVSSIWVCLLVFPADP